MTTAGTDLRRVCFVAMPFGRKTVTNPPPDAPGEVDFDELWERALRPAIAELGFMPVRADIDPGSLVMKDMIERLRFADLVVADVSLPNGNVYYEVGVRHVARETGCVLVAADWSRPAFDVEQFRAIRYPLPSTAPSPEDAAQIRRRLVEAIPMLESGRTPYFEFLPDPDDLERRRTVFRDFMTHLSAFQARVQAIHELPSDTRGDAVRELAADSAASRDVPEVATALLRLHRDELGWADTLAFAESLPAPVRSLPYVTEQYLLALGNAGEPAKAIAGLKRLIDEQGPNPERLGLIGGRYKRLWRSARDAREAAGGTSPSRDERRFLDAAIEHYRRGMELDLNEYYCAGNLPALLAARGDPGDADAARATEPMIIAACERALRLETADRWVWPTLLGAAFRAGDVSKAADAADRILRGDAPAWNVRSTLDDLARITANTANSGVRDALAGIESRLEALL